MAVFRRVRDLFGLKDGASGRTVTTPADLAALIDAEETAIAARTGPACEEPARRVRKAAANLRARLDRLSGADWDQAHHPKLEQISRTTLPAFVRAMDSCLARPLPEDPHELYSAASALLKCVVSALRGQGRYLSAVLPDEMSAVKADIDLLGGAVNAMTTIMGEERRDLDALARLRARLDRMAVLEDEEQDAVRRSETAAEELAGLARERAAVEEELAGLDRSAAAQALKERRVEAERLRGRAAALEAAYRARAEALVQVLRRAERLVAKRGDRQTATRLHHLQSALASPGEGDGGTLVPLVAAGLVVVRELVASGEIAPKEGDPLFDDPAAVAASFGERLDEQARLSAEVAAVDREVAASPVTQDRERLAGRLRQLEHRTAVLDDERAGLGRVAEQKAKERAALLDGLSDEVEAVFGGRVRLEAADA